jgi:hypothetical protein
MTLTTQRLFDDTLNNILWSRSWRKFDMPPTLPTVKLHPPYGKCEEFSTDSAPVSLAKLLKNFGVQRESSLRNRVYPYIEYLPSD